METNETTVPEPLPDEDLLKVTGGMAVLMLGGSTCNVCGSQFPPMDFGYGGGWRGGSFSVFQY